MDLTGLNFSWQTISGRWTEMNRPRPSNMAPDSPWPTVSLNVVWPRVCPLWRHHSSHLRLCPTSRDSILLLPCKFCPMAGCDRAFFFPHCPHSPPLFVGDRAEHPVSEHGFFLVVSHSCDSTLRPRFIWCFVVTEHPPWTVEIPSWFCVMVCCDRAPMLLILPHYILCNRASVFRSLPHVTWRPSYSFVTGVLHCSRAPYPLVSCERALFSCSRRTKNESVKHCLTMPAVLPGNEWLLAETAFV